MNAAPAPPRRRRTRRVAAYADPLPALGANLPPELLRDLMSAPPLMSVVQAALYLLMSPARVRLLVRRGELAGCPGERQGASRAAVSRSAVIAYWEKRYG